MNWLGGEIGGSEEVDFYAFRLSLEHNKSSAWFLRTGQLKLRVERNSEAHVSVCGQVLPKYLFSNM